MIWSGCGKSAENALTACSREIVLIDCTQCGKYIQQNLGKHIALYHMELAQLWRCPVTWCTVWKRMAQDCIDHLRRTHDAPLVVKAANLARYFPPWTVTREQWSEMTQPTISGVSIDTLSFSRKYICHGWYRLISRHRRLHVIWIQVERSRASARPPFYTFTTYSWLNWMIEEDEVGLKEKIT